MNLWLFYWIFGCGRGLPCPEDDTQWFILSGRAYRWSGWFGCQLHSFEWRLPKFDERRVLAGTEFRPFQASRRWFIYEVSWAMTDMPSDLNEANAAIRGLQKTLRRL